MLANEANTDPNTDPWHQGPVDLAGHRPARMCMTSVLRIVVGADAIAVIF